MEKRSAALRENFYINTDYGVIHEDRDILVIDKPAPLAVHPVGCYAELNLHSLLKKDVRWQNSPIKLVHRLDAETSGVLVVTKNYEAARSIGKQFLAGEVQKKYEAIVFGCPSAPSGDIEHPLGYDSSSGFQTIRVWDTEKGEKAHTRYEVLSSNTRYSRLRLTPFTGRTHQLRAHMAILGHPIVGDKIYIDLNIFSRYVMEGLNEEMLSRLLLPRLALHAKEITFTHPRTRQTSVFSSKIPPLLQDFLKSQNLD